MFLFALIAVGYFSLSHRLFRVLFFCSCDYVSSYAASENKVVIHHCFLFPRLKFLAL